MSKRSDWCEFSPEERAVIYERDYKRCIYCGSTFGLGAAHIFVSRAHGGKGDRRNGVLLCQLDHQKLDQGNNSDLKAKILLYCQYYLKRIYGDIDIESLKYSKWNMF